MGGTAEPTPAWYSSLFKGLPLGLYVRGRDGRFLDVNPALVRLLGYPDRDTLLATDARTLYVHPEVRQRWEHAMAQHGVVHELEVQLRRYDGSCIWVEENARSVEGRAGRVRYEGSIQDVDARKKFDQIQHGTLSLLRATIESTTDGLLVVDRDGRMVTYNEKFAAMWGLPEWVLRHRDDARAVEYVRDQLEDPESFVAKIRELYDVPETESYDELQLRDGRIFERYSQPQWIGNAIVGRVWSFRDVTRRRRLEERLRLSQRMEALGRLAGGVAHDFNNLLTVITTNVGLVRRQLKSSASLRSRLDEVMEASRRASSLTSQLLAFGRKQVREPAALPLDDVIDEVNGILGRLIGEDIEVDIRNNASSSWVRADRTQLEQVILNLAINARDAMPGGGQLILGTENVPADAAELPPDTARPEKGRFVKLTVTDTGEGMDAATRERIFEPFFTTRETGEGSGLGLSTVYGIVSQSGGTIGVDSEPGEGTTFRLYFPEVDPSEVREGPCPSYEERATGGHETVLVVEDSDRVRRTAIETLVSAGYGVLEAPNGDNALKLTDRHGGPIHLLITDVVMPEMRGPELARRFRRARPAGRVLYISGYMNDQIDDGELGKSAALLGKPFTSDGLLRKVREVLDVRDER